MAIERELKLMLNREGWERVHNWAQTQTDAILKDALQTNYYFDSPNQQLSQARLMLRLRVKNDRWEMTFKAKLERPDRPGQHSIEIECPLDQAEADAFLKAPDTLWNADHAPVTALKEHVAQRALELESWSMLGAMTTRRMNITSPSGRFVLELDHSTYCGVEDYEIECEGDDMEAIEHEVTSLLTTLGVLVVPSKASKSARFVAALKG